MLEEGQLAVHATGRIWNSCGQFEMESAKEGEGIGQRERERAASNAAER